MKVLVTAASDFELQSIVKNDRVIHLNTGIGIFSTVYKLGKIPVNEYDLILNIGIAGSFSPKFAIGDVLAVRSEIFGDFGIATENGFLTCFDEGLLSPDSPPFAEGKLFSENAGKIAEKLSISPVNGITNNAVSGENGRIKLIRDKFSPDIETMETAAFFYVCLCERCNFAGIRSVSNMVEPRNKNKWNIPLAVKNLSETVNHYINSIL